MAKSHKSSDLWYCVSFDFFDHPKTFTLSSDERELFLRAVGYSRRHLTDGLLSRDTLRTLGMAQAVKVCHCVRADRSITAVCDGWIDNLLKSHLLDPIDEHFYQIHDYLDWNPSREHVLAVKAKRSAAGHLGGRPKQNAKQIAFENQNAKQIAKQNESKMLSEKQIAKQNESKQEAKPNPEIRDKSSEIRDKDKDKDKEVKSSRELPLTGPTWEAYADEFQTHYGRLPDRNAQVNANLKNFVKNVGRDCAPDIARFYVRQKTAFYIKKAHDVRYLNLDWHTLKTQWETGLQLTKTAVKTIEKQADLQSQFDAVMKAQHQQIVNVTPPDKQKGIDYDKST